MTFKREIREGHMPQGEVEEITYFLDTRPWGGAPTGVSVAAFSYVTSGDTTTYTDVTSTVFPVNSPSVSGNIITLSPLKLLTDGTNYRIEIKFTSNSQVQEAYAFVDGER